jgi:NADPH-dependent 2,4-dienoyl-CoA reductase/sulfur reductase-like enzyme
VAERLRVDVAVVGAGPAGLAAACTAAEAGAAVALLDEAPVPGGQIWRQGPASRPARAARQWIERLRRSGARHLAGASVVDAPGPGTLLAERGGGALQVTWRALVLATGARELFLPFPGWTLPNVLGIGGAQALLKAGGEFRGKRVVIAGSGPLLLPVAASLARAGARVALVAEQADLASVLRFAAGLLARPTKLVEAAAYRLAFAPSPLRFGSWPIAARGDDRVREVRLRDARGEHSVACDVLATSFGLTPSLELPRLVGCAVTRGGVVVDGEQRSNVPGVFCAGEPTGVGGSDKAIVEGTIAGLAAADQPVPAALRRRRDRERRFAASLEKAFAPRPELRGLANPETLVCRCEDVPVGRLDPAWTPRQAKLRARVGMGPCQGRICGAALGFLYGWPVDAVRPPLQPVALETLAARPRDEEP